MVYVQKGKKQSDLRCELLKTCFAFHIFTYLTISFKKKSITCNGKD